MSQPSGVHAEIIERATISDDVTVTLYDWRSDDVRDGRNLIATRRDGTELWRAEPVMFNEPDREDCFMGMRWDGTRLTASTWSGYEVSVDAVSGKVTFLAFTK